ncbi:S phase cyclin A-associated protein in the endoplasmic reticulum [Cephus cinctus]|uniref:S phase cyclin A-associated protein in the endoplasmic reticulum n=1 Tax=Cephus cinctus TaxID=211228 RepID=A0AAJ7C7F6_CEPCN|nr:S phase cyclin A-associated protein in the endoplasmic reticulum [Cephus cinctus]
MADVRLLIQEEGRTARNLIAFNVPVSTSNTEKVTRKPPSVPRVVQSATMKRSLKSTARVRSASTGRDKKSELQARYWAFLFGNLQRAVDGIYQTCEEDESISECKEVILVLENYTRDFHNLIDWFKVKWAYESSPPPLRRTPLAWEVRKTSPCRTWSSSVVPRSSSSPTGSSCRSPVDQTIVENRTMMDESGHKTIKDNKNNVSRNDSQNLKDKCRTLIERSGINKTNKGKSVSTKLVAKAISKKTVGTVTEVCGKSNRSRSTNGEDNRELSIFVQSVQNCEHKAHLEEESVINEERKKNDDECRKNKEFEAKKNAINSNVNSVIKPLPLNMSVNEDSNSDTENSPKLKEIPRACRNNEKILGSNGGIIGSKEKKVIPENRAENKPSPCTTTCNNKSQPKPTPARPAYATVSRMRPSTTQTSQNSSLQVPKMIRSKTTLGVKSSTHSSKVRPGTSVIVRRKIQSLPASERITNSAKCNQNKDLSGSVEVLTKQNSKPKLKDDGEEGWQTVRSRYRRGSTHNLNMATRFHKPSTATSLPALCLDGSSDKCKRSSCTTEDRRQKRKCLTGKAGKNMNNEVEKVKDSKSKDALKTLKSDEKSITVNDTNSTSMIAAVFKSEAELLEKRIQLFIAAQAERERIILEEEQKREEADSQRSQQLSEEEASLQRQILELESTEIDIDTETDETDGEMVLEIEGDEPEVSLDDSTDDISLEDRYENMLEGMSWAERVDTLAQLQALVARHPGRALELHQKLSSPSRKRSLPETLRRYQTKQACAQHKRQKLLMEKSQRLRELLNKVEDVKSAKNQLIEDKRLRMEMKLKRAEENRTQHLLEIVRKAHDEDSKLKEIAFINELEAQNKRHDFIALCQEQEERLQGIQEERQRRQEEKAAKEAAAEERRRALEVERQLRIQKMREVRREREERVGKMQLEREKERQELAREKARDREERLSALHAAQLANQEELQKKIAQKQQESARRHGENIEHIRQRAVESSILRSEEVPPTLRSYPVQKQCSLCGTLIPNEVYLLSHLKSKLHADAVRKMHDGREPPRDELQRFNIAQIRDMPVSLSSNDENKAAKEKQKASKRRSRKMKQRMTLRGQEWMDSQKIVSSQSQVESANKAKFRQNLKELSRLCNNHGKGNWSVVALSRLERCLGEIDRAFSKSCASDQEAFNSLNGFETLSNLLNLGLNLQNNSHSLPDKNIVSICRAYRSAINGNMNSIKMVLLSNKILVIMDLLLQRLEIFTSQDDQSQMQEVTGNAIGSASVVTAAMQLLCSLVPAKPIENAAVQARLQDVVGYLVSGGMVERVHGHSRAAVETDYLLDQDHESSLLNSSYELLSRFCIQLKADNLHAEAGASEQTSSRVHLLGSLSSTEAAGAVGALYAVLALTGQNQKGVSPIPSQTGPGSPARILASRGLTLLRTMAELDLDKVQDLLGAEGTSLQWRLVASHTITRLSRDPLSEKLEAAQDYVVSATGILLELFTVLGYFAVNNSENQLILQSAGAGPSVLQQLCSLPFPFYGDPRLASRTLPALLAATHNNPDARAVLSCELSYQLLEEYRCSDDGKLNPLVRLLKDPPSAE